ncbi:MAG TPA: FKBP-type peptidyl-prolyl cis-trans isomerase [Mycobacteriales bacterium]|nr:FKBP-type peptidyl-prolyl cis-trans isomerase [Mycobacteriales bacterium]
MATSRRRERELARRRYERRRQAELERRARAKRRNTMIGAASGVAAVIAVLLVLTFTVFTGGSSKKSATVKPGATPSTSASPTAVPAAPKKCAAIKPNPPYKGAPQVPPVTGKVPTELTTKDIKVGHGPAAKAGDTLSVFYTGVSCSTGKLFDSSYEHKPLKPFSVTPLGTAGVITGWNKGLIGVRAGGVRELIIPAADAYGTAGQGDIKPNETLIFVVQVKSVSK